MPTRSADKLIEYTGINNHATDFVHRRPVSIRQDDDH